MDAEAEAKTIYDDALCDALPVAVAVDMAAAHVASVGRGRWRGATRMTQSMLVAAALIDEDFLPADDDMTAAKWRSLANLMTVVGDHASIATCKGAINAVVTSVTAMIPALGELDAAAGVAGGAGVGAGAGAAAETGAGGRPNDRQRQAMKVLGSPGNVHFRDAEARIRRCLQLVAQSDPAVNGRRVWGSGQGLLWTESALGSAARLNFNLLLSEPASMAFVGRVAMAGDLWVAAMRKAATMADDGATPAVEDWAALWRGATVFVRAMCVAGYTEQQQLKALQKALSLNYVSTTILDGATAEFRTTFPDKPSGGKGK